MKRRILLRKAAFWAGIGGAALLAQFAVELAADKLPLPGLRSFVDYIHRGPSGGTQ